MVILWKDYYGKGNFEKILLKHDWEIFPNWECLFLHREKDYSHLCLWMTFKLAGKKQNLDPMWRLLKKSSIWVKPTSFLDHVNLG